MARTFVRGLLVLEAVAAAGSESGARLIDLAARTGLDPATTQRLLGTLVEQGYCRQDPETKRFALTSKVLRLSASYQAQSSIRRVAAAGMSELRTEFGETVHLGIRDGLEVVYIDKLETQQSFALRSGVGQANPLHTTALGKAILSVTPPAELDRILADIELTPRTDRSIRTVEAFTAELQLTATRGYSVDDGENEDMATCIGAPIVDRTGDVVAAISISGPTFRMEDRIDDIGRRLSKVCRQIGDEV